MISFGNIRPEQLGDVRVLRTQDRLDTEGERQIVEDGGHVLSDLRVPGVRRVTVDLLVRGRNETDVRLTLERIRLWLSCDEEKLMLSQIPGQYYLACMDEITVPAFTGHSARITVTFLCRDHRPYNLYNSRPAGGIGPQTDNFTFNGLHVLHDMGCIFVMERETGIPSLRACTYEIPGRAGTVRYRERLEPEERILSGTLYLLKAPDTRSSVPMLNMETEERVRRIAGWLLTEDRADLVFDSAPDLTWRAEVLQGAELERGGWRNGRMRLQFLLQPFAEGQERRDAWTVPAGLGVQRIALDGLFPDGMGFETPVNLVIRSSCSQPVTDLRIYYPSWEDEKMLRFCGNGFSLESGAALSLDSNRKWTELDGQDANRYIASGDFPSLPVDGREIGIESDAEGELEITASVRPRWI